MKTVSGLSWPLCAIAVVLACSLESPVSHQKGAAIADNALTFSAFVEALPSPPSPAVPSRAAARRAAEEHRDALTQYSDFARAYQQRTDENEHIRFRSQDKKPDEADAIEMLVTEDRPVWAENAIAYNARDANPRGLGGDAEHYRRSAMRGESHQAVPELQEDMSTMMSMTDSSSSFQSLAAPLTPMPFDVEMGQGLQSDKQEFLGCPFCPSDHSTEAQRVRHIRQRHSYVHGLRCPLCIGTFSHIDSLLLHMRACSDSTLLVEIHLERDEEMSEPLSSDQSGQDRVENPLSGVKVFDVLRAVRAVSSGDHETHDDFQDAVTLLRTIKSHHLETKVMHAIRRLRMPQAPCPACHAFFETEVEMALHVQKHFRGLAQERSAYRGY